MTKVRFILGIVPVLPPRICQYSGVVLPNKFQAEHGYNRNKRFKLYLAPNKCESYYYKVFETLKIYKNWSFCELLSELRRSKMAAIPEKCPKPMKDCEHQLAQNAPQCSTKLPSSSPPIKTFRTQNLVYNPSSVRARGDLCEPEKRAS